MTKLLPAKIVELHDEMKQAIADIARVDSPEGVEYFLNKYSEFESALRNEVNEFAEKRFVNNGRV